MEKLGYLLSCSIDFLRRRPPLLLFRLRVRKTIVFHIIVHPSEPTGEFDFRLSLVSRASRKTGDSSFICINFLFIPGTGIDNGKLISCRALKGLKERGGSENCDRP